MIAGYRAGTRVVLGMPITIGDYDIANHQFHLLYPAYGAGQATPMVVNRPTYVTHQQIWEVSDSRTTAADADKRSRNIMGTRRACASTGAKSPLDAPQYLEVFVGCLQNDTQPHTFPLDQAQSSRSPTASGFFKVVPTSYPTWDYLQAPVEQASVLIDQVSQNQRTVWGLMVLDVEGMELPPSPDFENLDPDEKQAGVKAVFRVRPVALFAWKIDSSQHLLDKNFLFAKGNVLIRQAPPGGVITMDMVGAVSPTAATPVVAQPPGPPPAPNAPLPQPPVTALPAADCPPALPADAMKDRCPEQIDLVAAGLYMDAAGHVRHLQSRAAPLGEPPRVNFGDTPATRP